MPQTRRSICIAKNASIWHLGVGLQSEAKLANKDNQPHCSECGPVGIQQNNGNQSFHCLTSKDLPLKWDSECSKWKLKKKIVVTHHRLTNMRTKSAEVTATGESLKSLVAVLLWKKTQKAYFWWVDERTITQPFIHQKNLTWNNYYHWIHLHLQQSSSFKRQLMTNYVAGLHFLHTSSKLHIKQKKMTLNAFCIRQLKGRNQESILCV